MSTKNEEKTIHSDHWASSRMKMHMDVVITNIICATVFGSIGHYLDSLLKNQKPMILFISLFLSFFIAQSIIIYRLKKRSDKLITKE